jgi:hypothetical protein
MKIQVSGHTPRRFPSKVLNAEALSRLLQDIRVCELLCVCGGGGGGLVPEERVARDRLEGRSGVEAHQEEEKGGNRGSF